MVQVDTDQLEKNGFTIVRGLVSPAHLEMFEMAIKRFGEAQTSKLGLKPRAAEAFVDVFARGGAYTERIYQLLERLAVLNAMSVKIAEQLEDCGFLKWAKIEVPLIWPDILAATPDGTVRPLEVHQDFKSMKCERAWRLWVPLRPVDGFLGSMEAYPGTHRKGIIEHNFEDRSRPVIDPQVYAGIDPVVFDLPAGVGVLFNPLLLHGSVRNRSDRTRFTLLIQIQDYAAVIDPDDKHGAFADFMRFHSARSARSAAGEPLPNG